MRCRELMPERDSSCLMMTSAIPNSQCCQHNRHDLSVFQRLKEAGVGKQCAGNNSKGRDVAFPVSRIW